MVRDRVGDMARV